MDSTKKEESQEVPRKCFCARCFLPIDEEDKVDIGGQNFHRMCSTCCVCHNIPKQLKMFYGHVFCAECFKTHVLSRFRDNARVHTDTWWMQFAPGVKAHEKTEGDDAKASSNPSEKRCVCARCLQAVEEADKVEIGGQAFHACCAKCCACHQVPKENVKIYYGQVFCEDCFARFVLSRSRDNPADFFASCFDQWKNNPQFAEHMKAFMASGSSDARAPLVFVAPECRCRAGAGWPQAEPKKCDSTAASIGSVDTWELSFENRTDTTYRPESLASKGSLQEAAEKIEKLSKFLHERLSNTEKKKWKNELSEPTEPFSNWVVLKSKLSKLECPKCLWQCGAVVCDQVLLKTSVE